jgi:hypothetical protein
MSDLLVIDEWIWERDVLTSHRDTIFQFLEKVYKKCDRLVIVTNSPFVDKFHTLCKQRDQSYDPVVRGIIKLFKDVLLYNAEKCVMYDETDLRPLPEDIKKAIKVDDRYLIRAYITAQASILITTDSELIKGVSQYSVNCKHKDEFLPEYIEEERRIRNLPITD